ncbi:TPA: hypothetical protein TXL57_001960 [Streptococcus suis]|nr:hypothetical protein [Streptococcus suis]
MKQYLFPRYFRTLKEHRLVTDGQFRPVYSVQTPFFSNQQQIYKADKQLLATIDHQFSLEEKSVIINQDFQIDQLTRNGLLNKQIYTQTDGWNGNMIMFKEGNLIARTRNQGGYCYVDIYDHTYEVEAIIMAVAKDYRQIQWILVIPLFILFFWIIF